MLPIKIIHSYDTKNTSSKMETSHYWCDMFSYESDMRPDSLFRLYRSTTSCIAFTDTSSLATQHTSQSDSPSSTSVTTRPFLLSYHWETSKANSLMPSFPCYIPSEFAQLSFISLLNEVYLRAGILKGMTSPMKTGNPCFISQLVGASLPSADWPLTPSILRLLTIVSYLRALIQSTTG